jgi:RimJ/RimL family protein N-acetyltransferase
MRDRPEWRQNAVVQDAGSLLRLERETLWVTDDKGRLMRARTAEHRPAPLLAVARAGGHLWWATACEVNDDQLRDIEMVLVDEDTQATAATGWRPSTSRLLLDVLGDRADSDREERGPSFVLADVPEPVAAIECLTSTQVDRDELRGLMPEDDRRNLAEPWAVAVSDGRIAAVCVTARSAPASVEAGVWTYEPFRRRGFGAAAVASWSELVSERVVFYSATFDNVASQRIARSLGFRPLAHWWWIHACRTAPAP